jgi:hypothetical protein
MKIKISGQMNLEQFSERVQIAIAQLQEMGIKQVDRCNVYLTPVDEEGKEVYAWGNKKNPIKEIEIKPEIAIAKNLDKITIIKKDE